MTAEGRAHVSTADTKVEAKVPTGAYKAFFVVGRMLGKRRGDAEALASALFSLPFFFLPFVVLRDSSAFARRLLEVNANSESFSCVFS